MKYYKSSNFTKSIGKTGFLTIAACLLIAVGAISWFALSKNNKPIKENPSSEPKIFEDEYNSNDASYNEDVSDTQSEEDVADANKNVDNIKYESEQTSPQSEPEPKTESFIMPIEGNISKGFSDTALQYSATYGDMRLHNGIDIICEKGCDIKSVGSGSVKSISDDAKLGKVITVDYAGEISVKYCGMDNIGVKEGDSVKCGDVLGTLGEIPGECADNSHIHIEVIKQNQNVSPLEALNLE